MQEIEINDDNIPSLYTLSSAWNSINEGLTATVNDPLIFLDKFEILEEKYNNLAEGIADRTSYVVSDRFFDPNSPKGPAGTSAVILAPTDTNEKA